jgi:hypothetical protein
MSLTRSALPPIYYALFCIYEPMLTMMGFIGTLLDPTKVAVLLSINFPKILKLLPKLDT